MFACELSDSQRVRLVTALEELIQSDQDRVIIVDPGPAKGRAGDRIPFLGRQEPLPERKPTIV